MDDFRTGRCTHPLHVYWAAGGALGKGVAIPKVGGTPSFTPSRLSTIVVALCLSGAAAVAVLRGFFLLGSFPGSLAHWPAVILAFVFSARAVGDFGLMGFFKRVRGTPFATWDSWLFSPLCLLIAAGFFYVAAS